MTNENSEKVELLRKEFKKSALSAQSDYDFDLIKREDMHLVPTVLNKTDEGIEFEFNITGLTCLAEINMTELETLRTLMNALKLSDLYTNYKFVLHPNNLFQDIGLQLKVAFRDVYGQDDIINEASFVKEYLCLLGCLMQDKYSYKQIKESGTDLLRKNKKTKPFANLTDLKAIEMSLVKMFNETKETYDNTLMMVSKRGFENLKRKSRIAIILAVIFIATTAFVHIYHNRFLQTATEGLSAHIRSDFVTAIDELSDLSINRMDRTMMYALSSAFIRTEGLTTVQRDNILAGVTPASSEQVLEFWVLLAQGNYNEAIDTARLLDNDEYLVYGYLKLRDSVERDASLSGIERQEQLEAIDRQLDQFEIQYEEALQEEAMEGETLEDVLEEETLEYEETLGDE